MEQRENTRAHHRENCHRLGGPVNRGAPALFEQTQHGRNQCSGVANTNPENEVNNRPTPIDRIRQAPDTHTGTDQPYQSHAGERCGDQGDRHADPPPHRCFGLNDATDLIGDPVKITIIRDKGLFVKLRRLHFGQQSGLCRVERAILSSRSHFYRFAS